MRIVADESVDRAIVERLRQGVHQIIYVAELSPGITDDEVLGLATEHHALLLTLDKDFGELVFRLRRAHDGVVLVRLAGLASQAKAEIVAEVFRDRETELSGGFSVISPGLVRIRRPEQP